MGPRDAGGRARGAGSAENACAAQLRLKQAGRQARRCCSALPQQLDGNLQAAHWGQTEHEHTVLFPPNPDLSLQALPLNKAALAGAWKPAPLVMHALTVPEEVVLRSDARAAQRREFDATVAARQAQLEAEHQALLQAQEEEEEARQPRRALGHKPLPGRL